MPWYLIIITFLLNILFGIGLFYSLLLIPFHPKKKRDFLGIPLPLGIIYKLKSKLAKYITKQVEVYLESNPVSPVISGHKSKAQEIAENVSKKITEGLQKNKWFKLLPSFLAKPILKLVSDISSYFLEELLTNFLPNLVQRYEIKEKFFGLLSDENIRFIELKAKLYLTKPLVIIGTIIGFIFGIFNVVLLFIF